MSPEPSQAIHPPSEPRALWPWLLMPLAALALFATLHAVRHTAPAAGAVPTATEESGPSDQ